MDRDEALKLLKSGKEGVDEWNRRRESDQTVPDLGCVALIVGNLGEPDLKGVQLIGADLSGANLDGADLSGADLRDAKLSGAKLSGANFSGADLRGAKLIGADLRGVYLNGANLSEAKLSEADISFADLREANLCDADLFTANFFEADLRGAKLTGARLSGTNLSTTALSGADFSGAHIGRTILADVDLSEVNGLDSIEHGAPSTIGIDTLFLSRGKIPEAFLRGCGVPEYVIENQQALIGSLEPIQFYSCFISYSSNDEEFAKRLYSKLREHGLRIWFAPEDIQGGKKIHEQVDSAIRFYDRLLLVLSEHSINSKWVRDEIRRARKAEVRVGRRKLFPIKLTHYEALSEWSSFYSDLAEDVAEEIREYFIPDFSNWKDHDAFEAAFAKLLRDLKAEDSAGRDAPSAPATPAEKASLSTIASRNPA
jgi:TIR domain/Pentapeptide repeats (8 copies)